MNSQTNHRRRWFALARRVGRLMWRPPHQTAELVRRSYDRVAPGYDEAWTNHMRAFSLDMLDRLAPPTDAQCLDLTCGTGFVTSELARRTDGRATGVDASPGMLDAARQQAPDTCTFINSDVLEHLRSLPADSVDVITCAWGLGYTRPWRVLRQAARVLKPGGRIGIIDNTLFSLSGVLWAAVLTFAETPDALVHVMRVRFLPGGWALRLLMRAAGFSVESGWSGAKTCHVATGHEAIARLTATGAAAGFEFAAQAARHNAVFGRFAEIIEQRGRTEQGIPITHRYTAATGHKR